MESKEIVGRENLRHSCSVGTVISDDGTAECYTYAHKHDHNEAHVLSFNEPPKAGTKHYHFERLDGTNNSWRFANFLAFAVTHSGVFEIRTEAIREFEMACYENALRALNAWRTT